MTIAVLLLSSVVGCSPADLVGEGELPPGASDPKDTQTPAGAMRSYRAALIAYRTSFAGPSYSVVLTSALMADEMRSLESFVPFDDYMDRRVVPEYTEPRAEDQVTSGYATYFGMYRDIHSARAKSRVAAWLLRNFAPAVSPALAAQMDAMEGYADLHLAENFCSGIPLSTVDPDGYTLQSGSTTDEVFTQAMALFDTALVHAGDSTRILNFARVGKARALLGLGRYAEAAAAAAEVTDGFEYVIRFDSTVTGTNGEQSHDAANWMWLINDFGQAAGPGMSDNEGGNGIDWISSGDPRSEATVYSTDYSGNPRFTPRRYSPTGDSPLIAADWREAQLIQAEADLAVGGGWLDRLNALRQDVTFPPAEDDTTGTPRTLDPLTDPGTPEARLDLLFRERALWLHMRGTRLGDLRRLVRQYGRDPGTVYPNGLFHKGGAYGSDVAMPIPAIERQYNPLFTGCIHRGA